MANTHTIHKIQTGKNTYAQFDAATNEAFTGNMINPAVCYSPSRGWYVESLIHRADHDSTCRIQATRNATTGRLSIGGHFKAESIRSWIDACTQFDIPLPACKLKS